MSEYAGNLITITFNAVPLDADYRTFDSDKEVDLNEGTAGHDTHKTYVKFQKDGTATVEVVSQLTDFEHGLDIGDEGPLIWTPEGNAAGKPRRTVNAILNKMSTSHPYDDITEETFEFQFSGPVVSDVIP